ncbi:MAG TPA: hypothetical protein VJ861_13445 [Treponemataceae bacterium]|nr:hypothetical protein [Treponemataceae bacterium]
MTKTKKPNSSNSGRAKLSFTDADIAKRENTAYQSTLRDHQKRMEAFLDEIKARGGITALADKPYTKEILLARKTQSSNFFKSVNNMREGKGLISDPILLNAVLMDMEYSADVLFTGRKQRSTTELTMSVYCTI